MRKCIICGCSHYIACFHPDGGPCSWHSHYPPICSHCADEDSFNDCERAYKNISKLAVLTTRQLQSALKAVGYYTTITRKVDSEGCCTVKLLSSGGGHFERLLDCWYPRSIAIKEGVVKLRIDEQVFLLYRKENRQHEK